MSVVFAAAYVSAQQATPDVQSLAGKWAGGASPTKGSNVPLQVDLKPEGSYTSTWGSRMGQSTVNMEGRKLERQIVNGTGAAAAGFGKSETTLTSKGGKHVVSSVGYCEDSRRPGLAPSHRFLRPLVRNARTQTCPSVEPTTWELACP